MILSTANTILELYKTAKPNLSKDQLNWLGNLTGHAECEAGNLAETLLALATSDAAERLTEDQMQEILFGLADKAKAIAAFVHIGTESKQMSARLEVR